jgi:hypothetical protein
LKTRAGDPLSGIHGGLLLACLCDNDLCSIMQAGEEEVLKKF